jgi:Zn-dependent peptidase ImmA (M78 family)
MGTSTWDILRKYQATAPVPVFAMAEEMGLRVWESKALPSNISGKLVKSKEYAGSSEYAIVVNATDVVERRRFTVAHEVGHFMLHLSQVGDGVSDDQFYRSNLGGQLETEANQFAADLLMPYHLILQLQNEGVTDIRTLASRLQVSQQALKIRLGIPVT